MTRAMDPPQSSEDAWRKEFFLAMRASCPISAAVHRFIAEVYRAEMGGARPPR